MHPAIAHPNRLRFLASLTAAGCRRFALTGRAVVLTALLAPAAAHAQNLCRSCGGGKLCPPRRCARAEPLCLERWQQHRVRI